MKTKTIFLSLFLTLASMGLWAQEKYEYAYVAFNTFFYKLSISIDGKDYSQEKVVLSKPEDSPLNANPFFLKIHELESNGWEVIELSSTAVEANLIHFAYLRKKKN